MAEQQYYVISVKDCHKHHRYITFWRPNDAGYCLRLHNAGKYSHARVMSHLSYYNSGCSSIAVPCEVVDRLTTMTTPRDMLDGEDGPAVLNTRAKWRKLIVATIVQPGFEPRPFAIHGDLQ